MSRSAYRPKRSETLETRHDKRDRRAARRTVSWMDAETERLLTMSGMRLSGSVERGL